MSRPSLAAALSRACLAGWLALLLVPGWAMAGINRWTPIGPAGGFVTGLAFDGNVAGLAYATTTAGGFFRSTDGGVSWTPSNDGLVDAQLQCVIVVGGTVYVGGAAGVSRSDDHGLHFQLQVDSPPQTTALAAGEGPNPPLYAAGVFAGAARSDDGGANWTPINEGLERDQPAPAAVIHALLVDPRRPSRLWAGSEFGVYRSLDGGAHWVRTSLAGFITSLALDRFGFLHAGAYVDPAFAAPLPPAHWVSTDLGVTWQAAVRGLAARGVTALLAGAAGTVWAGTQDAGVFRTANGGHTWSAAGAGTAGQAIGALAQPPAPSQHSQHSQLGPLLLAGSGLSLNGVDPRSGVGVFRTTSGGARWDASGPGPDARAISSLVADAAVSGLLTADDPAAGIYRTRTAGFRWAPLNVGLPPAPDIELIAPGTAPAGTLYAQRAATDGPPVLYRRSTGAAAPWEPVASAPAGCFGPLATGGEGEVFLGAFPISGGGVCASADGGATWTIGSVGVIEVMAIAAAPADPLRVYASGILAPLAPPGGPTFFRSGDGGVTWSGVSQFGVTGVHGIAVAPLEADLVYAATSDGVQRSANAGTNWDVVFPRSANLVRIDPRVPDTIYAGLTLAQIGASPTPPPQLLVSDDGGDTWTPLADGLPPNVAVTDLAFDAASPSLLYAATAGAGVFLLRRAP